MPKPKPSKPVLLAVSFKQFYFLKGIAEFTFKQILMLKGSLRFTLKQSCALKRIAVVVSLSFVFGLSYLVSWSPAPVYASTANTINFQARLETATGAIVPDGTYNAEFKLYNASSSSGSSQGSCSGDVHCLWFEDYLVTGTPVSVANGYMTVNLGSQTAFPNTIPWGSSLYLGINIGGTGSSPTWDGEMSPRLTLTAVPAAFSLESAAGSLTSTLNFVQPTTSESILLPAESGTTEYVCYQNDATNCGYIANQSTQQTSANFNISGEGQVATLDATGSGSANTLAIGAGATYTGAINIDTSSSVTTGTITVGGTAQTGNIVLGQYNGSSSSTINIGDNAGSSSTQNVNIANSSNGTNTVNVGSTNGSSSTTVDGGTGAGAIALQAASGGIISIGTNATNPLNIGYSVAPTYVGQSHNSGTGVNTVSVTSVTTGDILMLATKGNINNRIVSVSGGGVSAWHMVTYFNGYLHEEIWEGTVTSPGTSTVTATYLGGGCSGSCEMTVQEFSSTLGASTNWTVTAAGQQQNVVAGNISLPSLTASENNGLYWGYGYTNGAGSGGGTGSFTYVVLPSTSNVIAYNTSLTKGTSYAPVANSSSFTSDAVAAIISASSSSVNIDGTTALEGAVTSPLVVAGTNNSTLAFQVQSASGSTAFDVDTVNNIVTSDDTLQVGPGITTATPRFLYLADVTSTSTGNPQIIGQWDNSNNWGIGPNSNSSSDNALRIGTTSANGVNTWSTTNQNVSLVVAGTENVQTLTNSATAMQVQNASAEPIFQVSTTTNNLVSNPGFEVNTTGWAASGSGASITRNTTVADTYDSQDSLAVTLGSGSGTGASTNTFTSSPAAGNYTFSFFAMGSASLTGLAVAVAGGSAPTCTLNSTTVSSSGFQEYYCSFTTSGSAITSLTITVTTASQTLYIDAVQLTNTTTLNPYQIGSIQLRGVITNPQVFEASSNSTTAFQVQSASGSNVLSVDTLSNSGQGQVILGKGGTNNAVLLFNNSSNGNTVKLQSGVTTAGYTLTLPTALGSSGNCLDDTTGGGVLGWTTCGGGGGTTTLQQAYNNSAGATPNIDVQGTGGADPYGGVTIQNDFSHAVASTSNLFSVNTGASSGLGSSLFSVEGNGDTAVTSSDTTGSGLNVTANSVTSGYGLQLNANALTTGYGEYLGTSSSAQSAGSLLNVTDTATLATNTATVSGNLLNVSRAITSTNTGATPVLDTSATFSVSGQTSAWSNSFTVSASHTNRFLMVLVYEGDNSQPTSVTYNGVTMSLLENYTSPDFSGGSFLYGLVAPASGANNITITPSTLSFFDIEASSWYNVNQITPTGQYTTIGSTHTGTTNTASLTANSTTGELVVDELMDEEGTGISTTPAAGSGQTRMSYLNDGTNNGVQIAQSYKTSGGTTTSLSWTTFGYSGTSQFWDLTAIGLNGSNEALTSPVASFSNSCSTSSGSACMDSTNILDLNQGYSGAAGTVLSIQNSGSGDLLDLENGSGTYLDTFSAAGVVHFQSTSTSTTAFLVSNSTVGNVLTADTTHNQIIIGTGNSDITATTPTLLVLDQNQTDPTEVDGAMYYNSTAGFRCGVNGNWEDCVNGPSLIDTTVTPTTTMGMAAAGDLYLYPIYIPGYLLLNEIKVCVTTTLGAAGDVGIFNSEGSLVADGGTSSLTTGTGCKTITPAQDGGTVPIDTGQYFAAVTWNSTTGAIAAGTSPSQPLTDGLGEIPAAGGTSVGTFAPPGDAVTTTRGAPSITFEYNNGAL